MGSMTPIYGITYPTGTDYVKDAPLQMQVLAQTVEDALKEVDARATPQGATPVIATMYDVLSGMTGVRGQIGYVYSDPTPANNGAYVYNGRSWDRLRRMQTTNIAEAEYTDSTWVVKYACRNGTMWISAYISSTGSSGWTSVQCPWVVPEGYRPLMEIAVQSIMENNSSNGSFTLGTDGVIKYNLRGGTQTNDSRSGMFIYPVPTQQA